MITKFHEIGTIPEQKLKFAVISSKINNKWLYVRHEERDTWEIPGGHREVGENIDETATRELYEESGALEFEINPIIDYSVEMNGDVSYGRLYYCEVKKLGELPNMEIKEVKLFNQMPNNLTYPQIQPYLHNIIEEYLEKLKK
jgi:8-oxo-dGTP diphosphatase